MSACSICGVNCPPEADAVEAGGDVGRCHAACFEAWDAAAEVLECCGPMLAELEMNDQVMGVAA